MARKYHKSHDIPYSTLIGIGVAVGALNLTASLPFDTAATLVQKENPWPNNGVYKTVKSVYTAFGLRGLYAGANIRAIQCILHSTLGVNLLYQLENKLRKSIHDEQPANACRPKPQI